MAVRRLRKTRARRLVLFAKPRVTAVNTKKGWDDLLRKAGRRIVVVMFRGDKSLMCSRFEPVFAELSKRKEFAQLLFAKVDVDKLKGGIVESSKIKQLPTFMAFRGGRLIETCEATSPVAVKQMLERVSKSTGLVRLLSSFGKFAGKCISYPLKPVGFVLKPKLWKLIIASPLLILAYQKYLQQHSKKMVIQKKEIQQKTEKFNDLVKRVGWRRAKQLQRFQWLIRTVREMKQFEAGVPVKEIKVKQEEISQEDLERAGASLETEASGSSEGAERWASAMAREQKYPAKYVFHPSFVEENKTRERQLQWIQEVKLKYYAFNANTISRWKEDVQKALCLKSSPGLPEVDWPILEFGERSVDDFKRELLLRTGFSYDSEKMDHSAYELAWSAYLKSLREDARKKLARTRKASPLTVYDYSKKSMFQGSRSRVFFGDPAPRALFWK